MVAKKRSSKRCQLKDKYKVQRKVREHRKKMRKFARDNPSRRRRKDPGIPNLWPYKEALLSKMADTKRRSEELEQRQKAARRELLDKRRMQRELEQREAAQQSTSVMAQGARNQRKWYMKDLKQVLEVSDGILEVLDARDPEGCRCRRIEEMIQGQYASTTSREKRIVLVLNKIDLLAEKLRVDDGRFVACFPESVEHNYSPLAEPDLAERFHEPELARVVSFFRKMFTDVALDDYAEFDRLECHLVVRFLFLFVYAWPRQKLPVYQKQANRQFFYS